MSYSVKIAWKVFGRLSENIRPYEDSVTRSANISPADSSDLIFNIESGKTLLREIGGNAKDTFAPLVLSPTHIFYNALRPTVAQECLSLAGRKFPLLIPILGNNSGTDRVRVNFKIRAYERIICISIESDEFKVTDPSLLEEIAKIESHPGLIAVTKKVLAMAENRNKHAERRGGGLKAFHCVQIVSENEELSSQFLAKLVTEHSGANEDVALAQIKKNETHKIDSTTLFCDRQGVVAFVPKSANDGERLGMIRRFKSAISMLELGAAIQRILTSKDPIPKTRLNDIDTLINDVDFVFSNSTSGRIVWSLFIEEFKLKATFEKKQKMLNATTSKTEAIKGTVLCMAAATVEFKTISEFLSSTFGNPTLRRLGEGKNYDVVHSYTDKVNGWIWYLAPQLAQGVTSAALDVLRIADLIQPDIVFMVGMCMGMPNKELTPGTVVVPNSITLFDHQRFKDGKTEYRPRAEMVASGLHNLARIASLDQSLSFPVIVDKGLACASVKIEDISTGLAPHIASFLPDVVAFDMEGWGFYQGTVKYQCLWIKAVSDAGERQGSTEKDRADKQSLQADVTKNAIQFAVQVLHEYGQLV